MVVLNTCVVTLTDDNDFGYEGNEVSNLSIIQLSKCLDEVVEELEY